MTDAQARQKVVEFMAEAMEAGFSASQIILAMVAAIEDVQTEYQKLTQN